MFDSQGNNIFWTYFSGGNLTLHCQGRGSSHRLSHRHTDTLGADAGRGHPMRGDNPSGNGDALAPFGN
jgi:hypothetical protein